MVSKEVIVKVIDELLVEKGLLVVKCKPSYRPSVLKAFGKYANQYGFTMKSYKDKDIYNKNALVTLYDPKHNTAIEFNKDFINENLIDFTNNNKKKINIDDIFKAYDNLPDKCKNAIGLIKHSVEEKRSNAVAWSTEFSKTDDEFHTITMPAYYIDSLGADNNKNTNSYEFVLAHESMHSRDYNEFTKEEKMAYTKYWGSNSQPLTKSEKKLKDKLDSIMGNDYEKFHISYGIMKTVRNEDTGEYYNVDNYSKFREGDSNNNKYLNGLEWGRGVNMGLNFASDYGRRIPHENYAEYGAMVITGYHNPTNPNATITINGEEMKYQEWARLHPYQIQSIVKDLYGEEPTIDDILKDTISTRYGDFGVKIEDLKEE